MIYAEEILKILKKNGVNFFSGVPDSVLKNFSKALPEKNNHVIAANEGNAVSLGIGYHLATKKIGCVYLQNSGLSNAINPIISIADKKVYSIPLILIIGWRGSPRRPDEPQHQTKGKITLQLLKLLKIKYCIIKNKRDLTKFKKLISLSKKNSNIVAALIEKGNLKSKTKKKIRTKKNRLFRFEFIKNLLKILPKKTKIISTTGYTSRELMQLSKDDKNYEGRDFYMVGGMGHSASVAAGYSLKTNKDIICLDGDGSILMHLGSMNTIGHLGKKNFKHVILNNSSHESVGGQPTYSEGINFKDLSKSLGYKNFFEIKNKHMSKIIKKFLVTDGPSLLEVKIRNGSLENLSRPKNLLDIKRKFMKTKS